MNNPKLGSRMVDNTILGVLYYGQSHKPEIRKVDTTKTRRHTSRCPLILLLRCYCLSSDPIIAGSLKPAGTAGAGIPLIGYSPVITKR